MIVSLDLARDYCRADSADDVVLGALVEAAEDWAAMFLNRKVFKDQTALNAAVLAGTAGERPMVINAAFTAAVLLITAHLYDNRQEVVTGTIATQVPFGAEKILWPYRVGLGV
ncbi:head-tail connector protein [Pulveribacter sp.]|uniref:head-tail connector protein n=1 Tax=Pulveribacter sp. TaxID=2678893 RepID=UPI0028B0C8F4|nr:head-tail connector protein [Pulveribacter sp.]